MGYLSGQGKVYTALKGADGFPLAFDFRGNIPSFEIAINEAGVVECPVLIDKPNYLSRYQVRDLQPGVYTGRIESISFYSNRVVFTIITLNNKKYIINGPKTTIFEIMKRSISKELSEYAKNSEGSQQVWLGFQYIIQRPEILEGLFQKIIQSKILFSFELKSGGIISAVKKIEE